MKRIYRSYEVEKLVLSYQNEEKEEVLQEIMEKCSGIIIQLAGKYFKTIQGIDFEDLISEANIVLWDATKKYDEKRGCSFSSYLYSCICRNYDTLYRMAVSEKRNPKGFVESFEQLNSNSEYEEEGDTLGNREFSIVCEEYNMIEMQMLLSTIKFSDREKTVINLLIAGNTKPDIARFLGVTTPSVHSYIKRIRNKLIESNMQCA